jgi:hypothetical protein
LFGVKLSQIYEIVSRRNNAIETAIVNRMLVLGMCTLL